MEGELEVTRLVTERGVTELFVQGRKDENLTLSGHGDGVRE